VVKLPAVWRLSLFLVTYRLGVFVAEGAASLKLLDKGVSKEALAFLVLFQFPVELASALIAGRWAQLGRLPCSSHACARLPAARKAAGPLRNMKATAT
jgi:hypothetical protein